MEEVQRSAGLSRGLAPGALVLAGALLAACDGGGASSRPAGDGAAGAPASGCPMPGTAGDPEVSFQADLVPFFAVSCAFLGCHDGFTRSAGLYLGPNFNDGAATPEEMREIHALLLSPSTTAPSLARVAPGEPEKSFAMLKLDGCHDVLDLPCVTGVAERPCGDRMPAQSDELPVEARDRIRRWIAQGAPGP